LLSPDKTLDPHFHFIILLFRFAYGGAVRKGETPPPPRATILYIINFVELCAHLPSSPRCNLQIVACVGDLAGYNIF